MLWTGQLDHANPEKTFAELLQAWEAPENRVFVIRAQEHMEDTHGFYSKHFGGLGTPVALAEDVNQGDRDNQRTGEIWMEVRYDPDFTDAYRHSLNAQPLHTDGSYIPSFPNATLMTCITNAGEGGETTFIAAEDVVAALEAEKPELLDYLSSRPIMHARSGDERFEKIIDCGAEIPQMNWNYYCLSKANSAEDQAATQAYFDFLQSSEEIAKRTLPVKLAPGDAVTWKDREVLHGRNSFVATAASERFLWKCAIDIGRFDA